MYLEASFSQLAQYNNTFDRKSIPKLVDGFTILVKLVFGSIIVCGTRFAQTVLDIK